MLITDATYYGTFWETVYAYSKNHFFVICILILCICICISKVLPANRLYINNKSVLRTLTSLHSLRRNDEDVTKLKIFCERFTSMLLVIPKDFGLSFKQAIESTSPKVK